MMDYRVEQQKKELETKLGYFNQLYSRQISMDVRAYILKPKHDRGFLVLLLEDTRNHKFFDMRLRVWRKLVQFMWSKGFTDKARFLTLWEKIRLSFSRVDDMPKTDKVDKKKLRLERMEAAVAEAESERASSVAKAERLQKQLEKLKGDK